MRFTPISLVASALLLAACGDAAPPAVRAGDVAYTQDEVLGLTPARRQDLALITALGVAVARGDTAELGEPLVERGQERALERLLAAQRTLDSAGVGDDVLRARYLTSPDYQLTVRHLIILSPRFESDAKRAQARAKAQHALDRIKAGEPFPDVAAAVSEEPGAEGRQGLLQPGRKGAWVPEFWEAANALQVGEISGVVETEYGFHVIRLEGRDTVPFQEARPRMLLEVAAMVDPGFDRDSTPPLPEGLTWADGAPERAVDPAAPDSATLATWDGHGYTVGDYRRALAALDADAWRRATSGDADARGATLRSAVARAAAAEAAGAQGLAVPESTDGQIRREWEDDVHRWAAVMGFTPGMDGDALKKAALAALSATGQNARLVRSEVLARAPLLRYAVPVAVAEASG